MHSRNISIQNRGFTLVEIAIVMGILSIIFAIGLFMSIDAFHAQIFRSGRESLVSALTASRARALTNFYQTPHGICYSTPNFILFRGTVYDPAAPTNEQILGNPSVTISSAGDFFKCGSHSEMVFARLAATTSSNGMITVTEPGHQPSTVSVNAEGTIIW
jgi:prepilin-type N-terminal cleavage/methylation domain-containing protein